MSMCCAVVLFRAVLNCCCNVHAMVRNDGFATSREFYACFLRDYRHAAKHLTRLRAAQHRSRWFGFTSYSGGRTPTTEKGDPTFGKDAWARASWRARTAPKKPKVAPAPPNLNRRLLGPSHPSSSALTPRRCQEGHPIVRDIGIPFPSVRLDA